MGKIKEALKSFLGNKKEDKKEIGREDYSVSEQGEDDWDKIYNHPALVQRRQSADRTIAELESREQEKREQEKRVREELRREEEQRRILEEKIKEEKRRAEERLRQNAEIIQKQIQATEAQLDGKGEMEKQVKTDKFGYRITKSEEEKSLEETMASSIELNKRTGVGELGESEIDSGDDEYNL